MPYLGRTQLGKHIPLFVTTVNASDTPTAPDDAPTITIYNQSFATVLSAKKIPAISKDRYTGVFHYWLYVGNNPHVPLDIAFTTGRYFVRYDWQISNAAYAALDTFDVLPGGAATGAVIGMEFFERPSGDHVVMQLDNGHIVAGRNPQA